MKVKNLNKFRVEIKAIEKGSEKDVVRAINIAGINIQRVATRFSPVNKMPGVGGGVLRNSNTFNPAKVGILTVSVGNKAFYSPYQEFGTGSKVRVPKGYETVAIKHKGSGSRNVSMKPQPFLVPAIEIEKPKLIERIAKIFR